MNNAKHLRLWRVHLDLSLQEVADVVDRTRQAVSLWELGKRAPSRADLVAIVRRGFGISMAKFETVPPTKPNAGARA